MTADSFRRTASLAGDYITESLRSRSTELIARPGDRSSEGVLPSQLPWWAGDVPVDSGSTRPSMRYEFSPVRTKLTWQLADQRG